MMYLRAEGMERQERLQYLKQTWKYCIWCDEDDEPYTLPDPDVPLGRGQHCLPDWDDSSLPAKTADRQGKDECGKNNLHAEEDFQ